MIDLLFLFKIDFRFYVNRNGLFFEIVSIKDLDYFDRIGWKIIK